MSSLSLVIASEAKQSIALTFRGECYGLPRRLRLLAMTALLGACWKSATREAIANLSPVIASEAKQSIALTFRDERYGLPRRLRLLAMTALLGACWKSATLEAISNLSPVIASEAKQSIALTFRGERNGLPRRLRLLAMTALLGACWKSGTREAIANLSPVIASEAKQSIALTFRGERYGLPRRLRLLAMTALERKTAPRRAPFLFV